MMMSFNKESKQCNLISTKFWHNYNQYEMRFLNIALSIQVDSLTIRKLLLLGTIVKHPMIELDLVYSNMLEKLHTFKTRKTIQMS